MKTAKIVIIIVLLSILAMSLYSLMMTLFFGVSFDGYYSDLDQVRNNKIYRDAHYLFTEETDSVIIDFVVKKEEISIVEIKVKNGNTKMYSLKVTMTYKIQEKILDFEQAREYDWNISSKLSLLSFRWCIVSADFKKQNTEYSSFDFEHNGKTYCLCYIID